MEVQSLEVGAWLPLCVVGKAAEAAELPPSEWTSGPSPTVPAVPLSSFLILKIEIRTSEMQKDLKIAFRGVYLVPGLYVFIH